MVFVGEPIEIPVRYAEAHALVAAHAAHMILKGCKCGHGLETHTYHWTGCWAAIGEGYARDFCDCAAFEVAP